MSRGLSQVSLGLTYALLNHTRPMTLESPRHLTHLRHYNWYIGVGSQFGLPFRLPRTSDSTLDYTDTQHLYTSRDSFSEVSCLGSSSYIGLSMLLITTNVRTSVVDDESRVRRRPGRLSGKIVEPWPSFNSARVKEASYTYVPMVEDCIRVKGAEGGCSSLLNVVGLLFLSFWGLVDLSTSFNPFYE